ncbi:hypothetical protein [Halopiger djelfimassiliensis]|uniref:hypothetical protein n=1 Tax=Halopiger djelfimassiliensis TaxID=1293047 RepID=UPI0006780ED9|nr:hypothetical protein [Halopiger djelfimassiliensis]
MRRRAKTLAVVAVVGLLVVGSFGGVTRSTVSSATGTPSPAMPPPSDSYVIEQGEFCQPIEPLSTGETVASFYDYRNHETHPEDVDRLYSSYGTSHLQEDDTSVLFLHEGTDGTSLVMVHDQVDGDTNGGMATFDIVGLPHEAEWVVEDDNYTGETNMAEFDSGDGWASASWIWSDERTDGGAIRGGFNDAFAVTVHPAFNEDAEFHNDDDLHDPDFHGGGEIEDWEVLSGDADNPDRTELPSLDDPVTIRSGTCDGPTVTHDRIEDGIAVTVDGADPDDHAVLQPPTGSSEGVAFDGIVLTGLEGEASITFENRRPDGLPASPDGVDALSQLAVTGAPSLEDGSATVSFSVDGDRLDEHGLEPDEIALYERDRNGDGWSEAETTVRDTADGTYRFEATVSSVDGLAVAPQQPDTDERTYPAPGFGVGGVVGAALLLVGLWAVRTRRE